MTPALTRSPCLSPAVAGLSLLLSLLEGTSSIKAQERETLFQFSSALQPVLAMVLSPDNHFIAIAASERNASFYLCTVRGKKHRAAVKGHSRIVRGLSFSPDGKSLASASADGTARLWDVATLKEKRVFRHPASFLTAVTFTADGRWLVTAGGPNEFAPDNIGFISVWDLGTGRLLRSWKCHKGYTTCLRLSSDGRRLYSGGRDGLVKAWDVKTGKEQASYRIFDHEVGALAASTDGKYLALAGDPERVIVLWDLATGRQYRRLTRCGWAHLGVCFSPDSKTLVAAGRPEVQVFDVASGKRIALLEGQNGVLAVTITADGKSIITAGSYAVKLWDLPQDDD
jgi:WD40 repeat protein